MLRARRQLTLGVTLTLTGALVLLVTTDTRREENQRAAPATAASSYQAARESNSYEEQFSSGPEYLSAGPLEWEDHTSPFYIQPGTEPYPWHFFELSQWVAEDGAKNVKRKPRDGAESLELETIVNASLAEIRRLTRDTSYNSSDALGGRYRYLPGAGVQYELYFRSRDTAPTSFHTVRVTRSLAVPQVLYVGSGSQQTINIILPYYNRLNTLQQFIGRFVALVEARHKLFLTVVRYSNGLPSIDSNQAQTDRDGVVRLISKANRKLARLRANARVRLVEAPGPFSRGGALMVGARVWHDAEDVLLFLCDVDMVFGERFLQRCRANTEPGHKVYFPVVFMTYNPEIVYGLLNKKVVPILTSYEKGTLIDSSRGYWIDFAFGMSCQYRSDFLQLSGKYFDVSNGWGLEDDLLYQHFKNSSMEVVRMPDPDLVHIYHKKDCDKFGKRFGSCLASKALTEASCSAWGLWVYKHMSDIDDFREFRKVF